MGIRDILVHLDDSAAAEGRLEVAILYARKHGAHLRGMFPITHAYYESRGIGERTIQERVETMFREKTAAAGVSSEWVFADSVVVGASVSDIVTTQGYYSDLVIVGQTNERTPGLNTPTDLPEHVAVACGRPVLVVPYAGTFETAGDRLMIAWRTGRESARGLHDAMPHIETAHHVSIVGVGTEAALSGNDSHFANVGGYLARHGVTARTELICTGRLPVGDAILNQVCEHTADLLVMGAFAPTRRGTIVLGDVARHVLRYLTVPVLLSH